MGNPMANTQIRLLVVDDEPALREVISSTLVARGYDVVTAKDGLEALDQLVESLPDMIKKATDSKLKQAFQSHLAETKGHPLSSPSRGPSGSAHPLGYASAPPCLMNINCCPQSGRGFVRMRPHRAYVPVGMH